VCIIITDAQVVDTLKIFRAFWIRTFWIQCS